VQFQSVLEKFTPYDTVFTFTAATQLTESALSSACMLHASIGSLNSSSTSSLHRHTLGEITEDAEEGGAGQRTRSGLRHSILSDADGALKERKSNLAPPAPTASSNLPVDSSHWPKSSSSSTPDSQISEVPPIPIFDKSLPATPVETPRSTLDGNVAGGEAKAVMEELARSTPEDQRPSYESRPSTHSTRPSGKELNRAHLSAGYTPYRSKVKLGPRPSAQRPPTPASRGEARPIANLPNSVRVSNRPPSSAGRPPSSASHRPISQQSNRSAHANFIAHHDLVPPPPLPHPSVHISALYQPPNFYLLDRPASPAPSKAPSVTQPSAPNGPTGVTPEKQRLMRALQLRKKQQMTKADQINPLRPIPSPEDRHIPKALPAQTNSADRVQENSNGHSKAHSRLNENAKIHVEADENAVPRDPNARDIPPSVGRSDPMVESIGSLQVDSSMDGKDAEMASITTSSGSATSEATVPSLKSAAIVQSMSPVLPPIAPQNRLSLGVSPPGTGQDSQRHRQKSQITKEATVSEETENADAAAKGCCPQFKSPTPYAVPENPFSQFQPSTPTTPEEENRGPDATDRSCSPPPKPATPVTVDEDLSPTTAQSEPVVADAKSAVSDSAKGVASRSTDIPEQRHEGLEGYKTMPSPDAFDTSDDESFYDDLQTATVEEAKPVMVGRSPINAVFNIGGPDRQRERNGPASSAGPKTNEGPKSMLENSTIGVRCSPSAALPQCPPAMEPAQSLLIKSTNVSSDISKRIKALEVFSGRTETGTSPPHTATPPSPPMNAGLVKKRMSAHSPVEKPTRTMSRTTPPAKQLHPSPAPTPTPAPASRDNQPSWIQTNRPSTEILAPKRKGDSISVTARIIRDPHENKPIESSTPSKPVAMNLHRSPLVVEHENAGSAPQAETGKPSRSARSPNPSDQPDTAVGEAPKSEQRRFSFSSSHSAAAKVPQSESFTKRLSLTIRHARNESGNFPRSASDSSSIAEDKIPKESRKARLMRRMSLLTAGSRRSIASAFGSNQNRQEDPASMIAQPPESIAEHAGEMSPEHSSIAESHAHVVDIGDLNIQFPDTLLWKRRFMRIDDQGFLILTPPTMEANKRGVSRRFHLSDFKKPSLPPHEREELPWSIVLDFEDGSCLQCACESRYAQAQVLRSRFSPSSVGVETTDRLHSAHRRPRRV
jgi:hypothetical protein